jgi:hypothetical protein
MLAIFRAKAADSCVAAAGRPPSYILPRFLALTAFGVLRIVSGIEAPFAILPGAFILPFVFFGFIIGQILRIRNVVFGVHASSSAGYVTRIEEAR